MRARVLLDKLSLAEEQERLPASHPLVRERQRVLAEIAAIHRRLLEPRLEGQARSAVIVILGFVYARRFRLRRGV